MKIVCSGCVEQGKDGGKTVFRRTSSLRPGWSKPEDYYILSPEHQKHPDSRTTLPAWMLDGCLASPVQAATGYGAVRNVLATWFDHEENRLLNRAEEARLETPQADATTNVTKLEEQLQRGIDELLQFDPSDLVSQRLRERLKVLEARIQASQEAESKHNWTKIDLANLTQVRTLWLADGFLESHSLGDLTQRILIHKNWLLFIVNSLFAIRVEIPRKVSKSNLEFVGTIEDSKQAQISSLELRFKLKPGDAS